MKIIQLSVIVALIASIVTEDIYVVAKLLHGALDKGAKDAKGADYWSYGKNLWESPIGAPKTLGSWEVWGK